MSDATTDSDTDGPTSRFRGPGGRLHFPRWSKGCWRGRPSECCAICYLRLIRAVVRA